MPDNHILGVEYQTENRLLQTGTQIFSILRNEACYYVNKLPEFKNHEAGRIWSHCYGFLGEKQVACVINHDGAAYRLDIP